MVAFKHKINPEKWVSLYADYLFQYTYGRINNKEACKDLVQETFLSALKAMHNFKGKSNEKTWLTSILKRKIIDYYRKTNTAKAKSEVRIQFYEHGNNKGKWIEERVPEPWEDVPDAEEVEALKKIIDFCIDKLPQNLNIVFVMKTIQNMKTSEICNELEISTSNLWVIIHRARLALRECLNDNWYNKKDF